MRTRLAMALVTGAALTAVPLTASAAVPGVTSALWDRTAVPVQSDCGTYSQADNGFCVAKDTGEPGVELGVKFTTSKPVVVAGVRVYRVDDGQGGAVTGSLWTSSGERLATGTFDAYSGHGWQELRFDRPVVIRPGNTYIASYQSPQAEYAFAYDYFSAGAVTSGPVTALQSVEGDGNGVFCYTADCVPTDTFRDSNYWVTPLWRGHPDR